MKIIRWIFGFPLATAVSYGLLIAGLQVNDLLGHYEVIKKMELFDTITHIVVVMMSCCSWVLLTCTLIPNYKKYAAWLPVLISAGILCYSLYIFLIAKNSTAEFSLLILYEYLAMIGGLQLGYVISSIAFQNRGWQEVQTEPEIDIAEIYGEQLKNSGR